MSSAGQYWLAVLMCAGLGTLGCWRTRSADPRSARWVGRSISLALGVTAVAYVVHPIAAGTWTARSSLPLNICDIALVIAAVTCSFPRWDLGVELTYFWGMAGTLQAVLTPDLSARFPSAAFVEFVVAHVGIVVAAGYLVIGLHRRPRRAAVPRVFAITVGYAAVVGVVDAATGANYMYLAHKPAHSSLLAVLGPWPWYVGTTAAVAAVLFLLLDLPFRRARVHGGLSGPGHPVGARSADPER